MTDHAVPNFLVVGAARSGTTALVEGLRRHPKVFITQPKEPHYFALHDTVAEFSGPGDNETINRVAVTDRTSYLGLYPAGDEFLALGDGSVSTLYYADRAVGEILRLNPAMKLVVILREPVERAYSSWSYLRARGFEVIDDFLEAVAAEPDRKAAGWHHLWHYTSMSHYATSVRTLQEALGSERVGVWFFDDLDGAADGTSVVSSVLRFLGVPFDPAETGEEGRVNVSGTPRVAALHKAIQLATRSEALRRTVKRMTSYRFREFVRRTSLRPSEVTPAMRAQLEPLFTDDLQALAEILPGPGPEWLRRHRRAAT